MLRDPIFDWQWERKKEREDERLRREEEMYGWWKLTRGR